MVKLVADAGYGAVGVRRAARGRVLRDALRATTTLVGAVLASSAAAQTIATLTGGGTITHTGGIDPDFDDQTAGGGGVQITNVTQDTGISVNGVTINETVSTPTENALDIRGITDGPNSTGVIFTGTNNLTTTISGGSAYYQQTNLNAGLTLSSSGSVFTGSYGINISAPVGSIILDSTNQSQTFTANGAAIAGINLNSGVNASIEYGTSITSGFATGVNASNVLGTSFHSTGGSINATTTGIRLDATGGGNTVDSQTAITAPIGISVTGTDGAIIVTSGGGTINSASTGSGTGIFAISSGGTNPVTIIVGAAIGGTTAPQAGVNAFATGASTGAVNVSNTAAITGSSVGIVASSTSATGNTIDVGANVTGGLSAVQVNSGPFAITVANGATVANTGANSGPNSRGIDIRGGGSAIVNNGTISSTGNAINLAAGGTVANQAGGVINGNASGVFGTGTGALRVDNAGSIAATNSDGIRGAGTGAVTVVNRAGGTITASNNNSSGVYSNTGQALTVVNAGIISAAQGAGVGTQGNAGLVTISNANGATIQGGSSIFGQGIQLNAAAGSTLNNYGSVLAGAGTPFAINSQNNAYTLNLFAGSTTGRILLGSGSDTLALYNGVVGAAAVTTADPILGGSNIVTLRAAGDYSAASVGTIDLGAGNNTLNLRGEGVGGNAGTLAPGVANVTTLNKLDTGNWRATDVVARTVNAGTGAGSGGDLTLAGTGTIRDIFVNGASLTLASTRAAGNAVIHAISPTINFAAVGAYNNNIDLAVANGQQTTNPTIINNVSGGAITLAGTISESVAGQNITFTGGAASTTTLSAVNSYTGLTTIDSGTLILRGGRAIADGNVVQINVNGVLALAANERIGSLIGSGALSLGANTLMLGTNNLSSTYAGIASGTGGITQTGTGTLTLSGANTFTGTTNVNGGTFAFGASNVLADASTLFVQNGTVNLSANTDTINHFVLFGGTLNDTGTLTSTGASGFQGYTFANATINANLGIGTFGTGSGNTNTVLNGTIAAGGVDLGEGTLTLGAANRLADTARVSVDRNAILDLQGFSDTVGSLQLQGTLNGTGTLTAASYVLTGGTVNANLGAGTLTQLSGTSTLNSTAAATTVSVNAGTLLLGASDRLADTANVIVAPGAILDLAAFSDTVGLLALNGTLNGTGTLTASQYQLTGATVNGNLRAGTLFQMGNSSVLNGTSAAAIVAIQSGTLSLGASERLANSATVLLNSGATFDLANTTETIGTLFNGANGGGVVATGTTGRLVAGGANADFSGTFAGNGDVDKTGTGIFTYAPVAATTTARLNALGGTLLFSGTTGGAIRVAGGTLTGAGTVGGNLSLSSGTLSPGTAAQPIASFQAASLNISGGNVLFDVAGQAGNFASDLIRVTGAVVLIGGTASVRTTEPNTKFQVTQFYTALQAGSLTGTFANGQTLAAVSNDPSLQFRLRYDLMPNSVLVELRKQIDFSSGLPIGTTPNELAVARALNGAAFTASDGYAATLNTIAAGTPSQRAATFDSISGEALSDIATTSLVTATGFTDMLRIRIAGNVSASGGAGNLAAGRQNAFERISAARGAGSSALAGDGDRRAMARAVDSKAGTVPLMCGRNMPRSHSVPKVISGPCSLARRSPPIG